MSGPTLFTDARPSGFRFDADPTGDGRPVEQPPQTSSELSPTAHRQTMAAKVAALFASRPGEWIDGREFLKIAGAYGWRTRISDCRRAPFNLNVVNRQRRVSGFTVSEYQLVPPPPNEAAISGAA